MPSFKGTYEHSIDSKGRVSLPAKVRKYLNPAYPDNFTILRGIQRCLYLYPEDRWMAVEEKLAKISNLKVDGANVIRRFLRNAEDISLDNQHRLALPSSLSEWAGISQKVTIIGVGDRLELWSEDELQKVDDEMNDDEYAKLFEQVMGDVPL
ncbi:MAG: division/cell wall cluster transcriptional repressor MraZ [Balneolales bacterium]|nr:division/cell wall cluster transcriptional repressor MraZ [Balneolales bacterium]